MNIRARLAKSFLSKPGKDVDIKSDCRQPTAGGHYIRWFSKIVSAWLERRVEAAGQLCYCRGMTLGNYVTTITSPDSGGTLPMPNNTTKRYIDVQGWGRFITTINPYGITGLDLESSPAEPLLPFMTPSDDVSPIGPDDTMHQQIAQQIQEFLSGQRRKLDVPVGILIPGLQRHILDIATKIEYGQTCTYSEVARQLGLPNKAKYVQGALMKNILPLIVPDHRVVAGADDIGSHRWNRATKARLLRLEAINSRTTMNTSQ